MERRYTIGQLAQAAQVPVSTVRYYERAQLLKPMERSLGNYRLYGPESLDRLRFIRAAQAVGFTVRDIGQLLGLRQNAKPFKSVQALIQGRLSDVEERMKNLRHVKKILSGWLHVCRGSEPGGKCPVLERLDFTTARKST